MASADRRDQSVCEAWWLHLAALTGEMLCRGGSSASPSGLESADYLRGLRQIGSLIFKDGQSNSLQTDNEQRQGMKRLI